MYKAKHSKGPYSLSRRSPYMCDLFSKKAGLIGMATTNHCELFQASPQMFELLLYIDASLDAEREDLKSDAYLFSGIHDDIKAVLKAACGRSRKERI